MTLAPTALLVLTAKSRETILLEGGSSAWRLDRNNARRCSYAICTRNAHAEWTEGPEEHHTAFLIGRISDVVPAPQHKGRYLIQFSEYAEIDIPDFWQGDRNPVKYAALDALGIDLAALDFKPMPEAGGVAPVSEPDAPAPLGGAVAGALTMAQAKQGLALTFGVQPNAIEITIRG